ncbi:type IV pilin protein [Alcanivorax sp. NBRC 102024]|uniref:type IV pilin protein n=1 Tax=Alcanivorax sp. NBRC 102024 TaxID=1113895 RepID=UPI000789CAF4|nr:type IV pilin protein [Alcanivorax sp. NBRC 102024]
MIKSAEGFTLIELMIVVVIVSILAAIAWPSYQNHVENARRTEAQGDIMALASSLETYRSQNLSYGGASLSVLAPGLAANDYYTVSFNQDPLPSGAQSYEITAVPKTGTLMEGSGAMRLSSDGDSCWSKTNQTSCTYGSDKSWN